MCIQYDYVDLCLTFAACQRRSRTRACNDADNKLVAAGLYSAGQPSHREMHSMISSTELIDALPDLVLRLHRDGTLLSFAGGRRVNSLQLAPHCVGAPLEMYWPRTVAVLIKQLTIRAIASRGSCETSFVHDAKDYDVTASAEAPDRAICVIRRLTQASSTAPDKGASGFDRRDFWRRFTHTVSSASLTERPIALAIVCVDGLTDISQLMDSAVCDQLMAIAMRRLSEMDTPDQSGPDWYLGQISDDELALVVESPIRDLVEACAHRVCASLSVPIKLRDATFQLKCHVGAAILGQDATSQSALLEQARAATTEARRSESSLVRFFSDTMKLRSLTRLDFAQELRDAISNGDIRLKYRGRHDLATGRLLAMVGYLNWTHPMRGEIRPAHFLGVASATGLSTLLSRSLLKCLREDFSKMMPHVAQDVKISYGALRHHVLDEAFSTDVASVLDDRIIAADRLELRISESTYVTRDSGDWHAFVNRGVQLVVDEVGRKMSSIDRLARAPLWGLQLDRSCATAVVKDNAASRVCRAVISMARALELMPIATAVDTENQRAALQALGCVQGIGDLYDQPNDSVRINSLVTVGRKVT
jgi:predicted signal transduction protein with EAL and GGDEF domain